MFGSDRHNKKKKKDFLLPPFISCLLFFSRLDLVSLATYWHNPHDQDISEMTQSDYAALVEKLTAEDVLSAFPDVTPIHAPNSRPSTASSASAEDSKIFEGHDEEQIKLMEEVCIVLDYNDKPIGSASKKTCKSRH